ncbi:MAG: hypothetical protein CMQ14_00945 [Gammaproteobacteria bacterium]|nr:hypothetical protein [Gammaproteobacteria bacterium]
MGLSAPTAGLYAQVDIERQQVYHSSKEKIVSAEKEIHPRMSRSPLDVGKDKVMAEASAHIEEEGKQGIGWTNQIQGLNHRQALFVAAYLEHGNGTKAAREAGYSHPDVHASRMLRNDRVIAAITRQRNALTVRTQKKGDVVIDRLWAEAENMENSEAVRVRALELLGKVHGIYEAEKKEISVFGGSFLADLDLSDVEEAELLQELPVESIGYDDGV